MANDVRVDVDLDTSKAEEDAEGLKGKLRKTFGDMGKIAGGVFMAEVGGAIASKGVETLKNSISLASDFNEIQSKSNTIFGEGATAINKWASGASTGFGQSKASALDAASSFGNMFTQLGMGGTVAADMSVKMTELASDFASFHNADITEVLTAQQAAFRGEYDALQKFVPTINAAAVAQEAMAQTGKTSTAELTAGEKAAATYSLMLKGAGDAAGDFDRTSGSLSNQQRVLSAQWQDFQTQIGQVLIPALTKIAITLNTDVIPAVAKFAGDVKKYWESDIEPAVNNMIAAWEKIAPIVEPLAKVTLVMLEVQFKALVTPIKIIIDLLSGDFSGALNDANALVTTVTDAMGEAFGLLQQAIEAAIPLAAGAARDVGKGIFDGIWEGLGDLWQLGADIIDWVLQGIMAMAGGLITEAKRIGGEIASALNPVNVAKGAGGWVADKFDQVAGGGGGGGGGAAPAGTVWDPAANAYVPPWEVGNNLPKRIRDWQDSPNFGFINQGTPLVINVGTMNVRDASDARQAAGDLRYAMAAAGMG